MQIIIILIGTTVAHRPINILSKLFNCPQNPALYTNI